MTYTIKQQPEDFIVEEVLKLSLKQAGKYSYYILKKTNLEQGKAIEIIAKTFNIQRKFINIAGTKDKKAITIQTISIQNGKERNIKNEHMELTFKGKGDLRLSLGMLEKNKFTIIVRNAKEPKQKTIIPNYFGEQRFGINNTNQDIGEAIVRRDFKKAIELIKNEKSRFTQDIINHLEKQKNDYIGALKILPKQNLRMYIHAFQSHIFNTLLKSKQLNNPEEHKDLELPLIGFETEDQDEIFKQYNLTPRDFIIRQCPELTETGATRKAFIEIEDLNINKIDDNTYKTSFSLPKGSYATVVIKELFGE